MAWVFIFLLIAFIFLYSLTRIVWVRLIKEESFKAEIHLPIFAIVLIKKDDNGDNVTNNGPSPMGYIRIITDIIDKMNKSNIKVNKVIIPIKTDNFTKSVILRPIRQHAIICALIAYLRTKTRKLTIEDNAITLSPDINVTHFYITIKLRLFQLIRALISLWRDINQERKKKNG